MMILGYILGLIVIINDFPLKYKNTNAHTHSHIHNHIITFIGLIF